MREIVAAQVGTTITNDMRFIAENAITGATIRLLCRKEMQLMSACGLGHNWDNLANAKTICIENDDGTFSAA